MCYQAGVPASAVRFWEQSGLLHPQRDRGNRYRLYDVEQLRRLRVIALLRQAGYGVPRIADVLGELSAGRPEKALAAVERRRAELAEKSRLCAAATAALWSYWQAGAGEGGEEVS